MNSPTTVSKIALAAPHRDAIAAARGVIAEGGNAIDAAVTAAVVLTVVYPHMCSVGGDLISLVRVGSDTFCVNASGGYGSAAEPDELFEGQRTMPTFGPYTVSVPGVVSGWLTLLDRWGTVSASRILAPAIALARDGMVVSHGLAAALRDDRDRLQTDPGMRDIFFPNGKPAAEGQLIKQSALAETLQTLADEGLESFYTGTVATRLALGCERLSVPIAGRDLERHHARVESPLSASVGPLRVWTAAPNSQGFTLLRSLGAAETVVADGDITSVDEAVLAELFHSGDFLRDTILADPEFVHIDVDGVLSANALEQAAREAMHSADTGRRAASVHTPRPNGDTIAVTAVDSEGTAISLIQSVFHAFGALILEPRTGIVLHNRAAFFSLDPDSPNVIAAGKRPAHTLVPVIVDDTAGSIAAHGTMGGKAQSQIHAQLILRALAGDSPEQMVTAPRFIVGGLEKGTLNDFILVESRLDDLVINRLRRGGLPIVIGETFDSNAGHSMVARVDENGNVSAGADPRSDGGVVIAETEPGRS